MPPLVSHNTTHLAPDWMALSMQENEKSLLDLKPSKKCSQSIIGSILFSLTDLTDSSIDFKFSSNVTPSATST